MTTAITPYEARPPAIPSETTVNSLMLIARTAIRSGLAKTKNEADAFFIIMYGLELGVAPMTSLRTIYSVQGGAPTCSGELMLALIRRSGKAQIIRISSTEETLKQGYATVYSKRSDSGDEFTAKWGKEDDARAGLKSNRDKYPAQMWTWRAVSIMNKALYSDVNAGLYAVEEIYPNTVLDENGEPVGEIISGDVKNEPQAPPAAQIPATVVEAPVVAQKAVEQALAAVNTELAKVTPKYGVTTNGGEPPAVKWGENDKKVFWEGVFPLYNNKDHARNSVGKMMAENIVQPDKQTVAEALAIVQAHVQERQTA